MKLRPFELSLVVGFAILMFVALFLLKTYEPTPDSEVVGLGSSVVIWGTLPADVFSSILTELGEKDDAYRAISYRYIPPEDFDTTFVNALADQTPPDLLFMSHEKLVEHRNRLQAIPYESFPERDFRDTYIDGAGIFMLQDGVYAFPVGVDPLVMYWNRNIFSDNGLLKAPSTWEEIVSEINPKITTRNFNRNIELSAIAMGEYTNVKNSFSVISMLLAQGGSQFVTEREKQYQINLDSSVNGTQPLTNSLLFYTNFSNVNNTQYSWNRSLSLDRDMFVSEDLALYFGYGSEGKDLEAKNPNLTFDIAEVPQGVNTTNKRTYGNFYGFFIPKASKNKQGAITTANLLSGVEYAKRITEAYNIAPVNRQLLSAGSNDIYGRIIYKSAPNARGWLNPDRNKFDEIFSKAISDVSSNRTDVSGATGDTVTRLRQLY